MCYILAVPRRWLVFVHQLPAHPSNGRVKIWRRLQQVGAIALKNAVHVLPDSAQSLEDFEWLREEVVALGGEASIFTVSSMSQADERYIVGELKERKTMQAIENQPPSLKSRAVSPVPKLDPAAYRNRVWVTRPRPGVDRFASAWLIRRFIDRGATFVFAAAPDRYPDAVPFDMYHARWLQARRRSLHVRGAAGSLRHPRRRRQADRRVRARHRPERGSVQVAARRDGRAASSRGCARRFRTMQAARAGHRDVRGALSVVSRAKRARASKSRIC